MNDVIRRLLSDQASKLIPAFRNFFEDFENGQIDKGLNDQVAAKLFSELDNLWHEINNLPANDVSLDVIRGIERKVIIRVSRLSRGVQRAMQATKKGLAIQDSYDVIKARIFNVALVVYAAHSILAPVVDNTAKAGQRVEFDMDNYLWHPGKMEENSSGTDGVTGRGLESQHREFKYFNADGTQIGDQNLSCSKTANTHNRLDTPVQFIYEWIVRSNNVIERWLDGQMDNVEATKAASRFSRCGLGGVDVIDMIIRDRPDESEPFADLREEFEIAFEQLLLLHGATALVNYNLEKGLSASASDRRSFFEEVKRRFGGRSDALLEIPEP